MMIGGLVRGLAGGVEFASRTTRFGRRQRRGPRRDAGQGEVVEIGNAHRAAERVDPDGR